MYAMARGTPRSIPGRRALATVAGDLRMGSGCRSRRREQTATPRTVARAVVRWTPGKRKLDRWVCFRPVRCIQYADGLPGRGGTRPRADPAVLLRRHCAGLVAHDAADEGGARLGREPGRLPQAGGDTGRVGAGGTG